MANEIEVHDNYLSKTDFDQLENLLLKNGNFPYFFNDSKVSDGDGFAQFVHQFYDGQTINSNFFDDLHPILYKLNPVSLITIKANLQLKDTEIRVTGMHNDITHGYSDFREPIENQKTGILYMNTNNGKTVFEDGEHIESIKNRMIIFPASKRHAGTTHTDTICRCLINFNWF